MARKSTSPASRSDDPAYHHGDLRKALLEAAAGLLAAEGAGAVGMREIARRAGVSHAAPYRHYASREALLADLARSGFERLNRRFADLPAPVEPERRFVAMARAYVRFALDEPQTWRLMFGEGVDKQDHPDLMQASGLTFDMLRQVVQALGVAAPATLESLAAWAMAHGVARLVLDQRIDAHLDAGVDPDELVVRAAHVFIVGVRPASDRRGR